MSTFKYSDHRCATCECYCSERKITNRSYIDVKSDKALCSYTKKEEGGNHFGCAHFSKCGQIQIIESRIESEKQIERDKRANEKAMALEKKKIEEETRKASEEQKKILWEQTPDHEKRRINKYCKEHDAWLARWRTVRAKRKGRIILNMFLIVGGLGGAVVSLLMLIVSKDKLAEIITLVICLVLALIGFVCKKIIDKKCDEEAGHDAEFPIDI